LSRLLLISLSRPKPQPIHQPKRIEKAKILIANTSMDTDKIKIFGSRVRVDSMQKVGAYLHCPALRMDDCGGDGYAMFLIACPALSPL